MTVSGKHFHQTTVNPTSPESDSASVQAFICVIISIMSHVMKIYFNKGILQIKKAFRRIHKMLLIIQMVGVTELESVTSTMSTWRSNQLSYTPIAYDL